MQEQKNRIIALYEPPFFERIQEITDTTNEVFEDIVPILLDHAADQNPSVRSFCPSSTMSSDLAYLSGSVNYKLTSRPFNLRRIIKIVGKNIPIVVGGTVLSLGAFCFGAYLCYQQYPVNVFDEFMAKNTTYYNNWGEKYTEDYFTAHSLPETYFMRWLKNNDYFTSCRDDNDMLPGKLMDWINYMHSIGGCSVERFYNQLEVVINSTSCMEVGPMICMPRDNTTLCCLRAKKEDCQCGYSVDILIGNALKAQEAAVGLWKLNLALYSWFAGPFSFIFIWMLLLSHFCL